MTERKDQDISHLVNSVQRGSIIAPAGCGKTEQIARAVAISESRKLVLTHTHAGVDALRFRLRSHNVPPASFAVETIAGWCLRYAASFPAVSGLAVFQPKTVADWHAVYAAMSRLLSSGSVDKVILASYGGVLVDEYQDCTRMQHKVIDLLANLLPCCVFGDELQAIFDFSGDQPVDWPNDVYPNFPKQIELDVPWRWTRAGNHELAEWLLHVRSSITENGSIDLSSRPACVRWVPLPTDDYDARRGTTLRECLRPINQPGQGSLTIIADAANVNARSRLSMNLSKWGFSNIEPIMCKELYSTAAKIQDSTGIDRLFSVLEFAAKCLTRTNKSQLLKAISAAVAGSSRSRKFRPIVDTALRFLRTDSVGDLLAILSQLRGAPESHLYRRQMYFAMTSALRLFATQADKNLPAAVWQVQNRLRHTGRDIPTRSIGSTLLIKGLEFEHAVLIHSNRMTLKDVYVALTRPTKTSTILSQRPTIP